jgi:biotin carboxyl carrier protein
VIHQRYRCRERHLSVELQRAGEGRFTARIDGEERRFEARLLDATTVQMVLNGRQQTVRVARVGDAVHVAVGGEVHVFVPEAPGAAAPGHAALAAPEITAPMPGKVLQVLVTEGQEVETGDGLLILEAMKMENRIVAEAPAVVRRVLVAEGQMVDGGTLLLELEYRDAATS